jgi:hypothetical protein
MLRRACLLSLIALTACSSKSSDDTSSTNDELHLESEPIATSLTELKAGMAYTPGVDETPLAIGAPCVAAPVVTVSPGQVASTATVVETRESLSRELGFSLGGTIPVAGGITGAAGLTMNTSFDDQSAVVLFQATGTYDSVLTGASAVALYDEGNIDRCGFGYVARASHRVTAAMVVSVHSTSNDSDTKASASLGKADIASAKADISNLISRGQVEIAIRFATDVIPGLPQAPFADSAIVVGTSDADKQNAQEKLDRSLGWLANAQGSIATYLLNIRTEPDSAPAAPTQSIQFRYWPGTPLAVRGLVDHATETAGSTRTALVHTLGLIDDWETYAKASTAGIGYEWNVPLAPLKTVADLDTKKRSLLDDNGGALRNYQHGLEDDLDTCFDALRYDVTSLAAGCGPTRPFPLDERTVDIRHISYVSVDPLAADDSCPDGQRLPLESEAPIFSPWSKAKTPSGQGVWTQDNGCTWSSGWIYDGNLACTPFLSSKKGLRICVSNGSGPFPAE